MNKRTLGWGIWIIIMVLFVSLQVYNYVQGNYIDLLTTVLIVVIAAMMLGVIILIRRKKET